MKEKSWGRSPWYGSLTRDLLHRLGEGPLPVICEKIQSLPSCSSMVDFFLMIEIMNYPHLWLAYPPVYHFVTLA